MGGKKRQEGRGKGWRETEGREGRKKRERRRKKEEKEGVRDEERRERRKKTGCGNKKTLSKRPQDYSASGRAVVTPLLSRERRVHKTN